MNPAAIVFDRMSGVERYFGNWVNIDGLRRDFELPDTYSLEDVDVLFAAYNLESYEGDAFVVFTKGGRLYEVHGSHCSCFGLEGQFRPEETSWAAMKEYKFDIGQSREAQARWHELIERYA